MEHIRKLVSHFKEKDGRTPRANESLFAHVEETLLPHLLRVLQKDNALMSEIELFPGVNVGACWEGTDDEWRMVQMALLYSVLHGDPKEKFGKILETVKGMIPGGTAQADEIGDILNDEENQNSLKEMLELLMNTRLASIVGDIAQSLEYADLGLNFEDPQSILNMLRNPSENHALKELMERAQQMLEDRIRSGKINQQELVREIEMLRAKFQSAFGRYLNEMVVGDAGGGTSGNTSQQILSNSPEARRARMVARLQKRQQEKLRKGR
jgi:hypothetical protein